MKDENIQKTPKESTKMVDGNSNVRGQEEEAAAEALDTYDDIFLKAGA